MITFNITEAEANTIAQALDFARKHVAINEVRVIVDLFDKLQEQAKAEPVKSDQ